MIASHRLEPPGRLVGPRVSWSKLRNAWTSRLELKSGLLELEDCDESNERSVRVAARRTAKKWHDPESSFNMN
jgi:hypothetical protein